jgi:hypothetical protein
MRTSINYLVLVLLLLFSGVKVNAQVKVGDNPTTINPGSLLELESTNKGLLMPRINLTNTTTWGLAGTPAAGMHVYNSNMGITSTDSNYPTLSAKIGEYYWDGTGWVALASMAKTSSLVYSGINAGPIVTGNDYLNGIGTTPNYDPFNGYSAGVYTIAFDGWFVISFNLQILFDFPSWENGSVDAFIYVTDLATGTRELRSETHGASLGTLVYARNNSVTLNLKQGDKVDFVVQTCSGCWSGNVYRFKNIYQTITTFQ